MAADLGFRKHETAILPASSMVAFLKIRETISAAQSVFLGLLPILLLLAVWTFVTWGKTDVLYLPDGTLDSGEVKPEVGRTITDGTGLKIAGWRLEQTENDSFLVFGDFKLPLHNLYARTLEEGLKIKLKRGKIIGRRPLSEMPGFKASEAGGVVGRGGLKVPSPNEIYVLEYQYEDVESRLLSNQILPSPMEVLRSFPSLWTERKLLSNIYASFLRVFEGFFVALAVVFPLGIAMGSFTRIRAMFAPLMVFAGYLPIPALVPLFMSLFGTNELQKVMFLAFAFGIYLLPLIVRAVESVDSVYLLTAYTLGAGRWQAVRHVLLAIALPDIYDAMRMGFGVGWGYIILAEMVDMGSGGLGALILGSQRIGPKEHIYLVLLVIVVLAFITDKLWEYGGNFLFPYRRLKL